jgi:hypothetical protein
MSMRRVPTHVVRDGFHRFHASIIAGFECLPVASTTLAEAIQESRNLGYRP